MIKWMHKKPQKKRKKKKLSSNYEKKRISGWIEINYVSYICRVNSHGYIVVWSDSFKFCLFVFREARSRDKGKTGAKMWCLCCKRKARKLNYGCEVVSGMTVSGKVNERDYFRSRSAVVVCSLTLPVDNHVLTLADFD